MLLPSIDSLNQNYGRGEWPEFVSIEVCDEQVVLGLKVPDELSYFEGHFPEHAVVPGVVQVHWAGQLAEKIFMPRGFRALKGVKFNSMLLPQQSVELALRFKPDKALLFFTYQTGDEKISSGQIHFSEVVE